MRRNQPAPLSVERSDILETREEQEPLFTVISGGKKVCHTRFSKDYAIVYTEVQL